MSAILRRELSSYFRSPLGYVFLAVFYVFSGYFFFAGTLYQNSTDISVVFSSMFTIVLFIIPLLTMRLFSEDKKYKTDQALLTAPVSLPGMVMGKFLAALIVFIMGLAITIVFALVIASFARPDWAKIVGNFTGLLLMGMALTSIGAFISALTENQMIAAIGGFASGLVLIIVDSLASVVQNPVLSKIMVALSFNNRYTDFTSGIFDLSNVVFFLSVCALFLFLTVRVFERRRWS
ncbi:ABC transporter permease [Oscillospiraceae bacterium MB08-C2-2]|nr:ABC transporter permease [Oscillospiraceae bacterium MB08-C2-2]